MKTYQYKISEEKYSKAIGLIQENGGSVYTDGSFSIQGVKGRTGFDSGVLVIGIDDKPFLASWSMIKSKLDEFFS